MLSHYEIFRKNRESETGNQESVALDEKIKHFEARVKIAPSQDQWLLLSDGNRQDQIA